MQHEHKKVPGPRMPPLYFAGRRAELAALHEGVSRLCESGDPSNGLQLVTGVPGVGKRQLGREFTNQILGKTIEGRVVGVLIVTAEDLDHPIDLFIEMSRAIGETKLAAEVADHADRVSNVSVKMPGAGGGVSRDIGRHTPGFGGLLRKSLAEGMWQKKALVLVVDELQGVKPTGMDALKILHAGASQCPVYLIGLGLQHTPSRLAAPPDGVVGVSRVVPPIMLGPLSEEDTVDAFRGNFDAMGVLPVVPTDAIHTLAKASHGFPQHINGYLEGASATISKHGRLDRAALAQALARGDRIRTDYYADRLSSARSERAVMAVAEMMESTGSDWLDYHDATELLERSGFDKEDLEATVQYGALSLDRHSRLSFGIPSFRTHVVELLREREQSLRDRTTGQ